MREQETIRQKIAEIALKLSPNATKIKDII
jgi:hypothetical protein